jgi:hypothetical protein
MATSTNSFFTFTRTGNFPCLSRAFFFMWGKSY